MTTITARLELKKTIAEQPQRVFEAWTRPDLLSRWLAPGESTVLKSSLDVRPGGQYRIRMKGEMRGVPYDVVASGVYERIVPNELLSFTWTFEDAARRESVGDSLVTVTFRSVPEGTELILVHEKLATRNRAKGISGVGPIA